MLLQNSLLTPNYCISEEVIYQVILTILICKQDIFRCSRMININSRKIKIILLQQLSIVNLNKGWLGTILTDSHFSVRGANSQRIEGNMALKSSFEVLIRSQISLYFQVPSLLMTIQRVVNSFYIFPIGFIEVLVHLFEVPNLVINDYTTHRHERPNYRQKWWRL